MFGTTGLEKVNTIRILNVEALTTLCKVIRVSSLFEVKDKGMPLKLTHNKRGTLQKSFWN